MSWWAGYVGLPFGEGQGEVTCWSLVARVYRDHLAIDLPAYGEISARDLVRVARTMEARKDDGWQVVTDPQAFDVCLMRAPRGGSVVAHVGVMVDAQRVLHVEQASAAVVVPVKHFTVAGRILGYRRRAE
jgi:cell wall-associated NlpC family hydrolase